jgi:hypothetical protein
MTIFQRATGKSEATARRSLAILKKENDFLPAQDGTPDQRTDKH